MRSNSIPKGSVLIPLTKDQFAIIDAVDAERVSARQWYANAKPTDRTWYAYATCNGKKMTLHRFVLHAQVGDVVDHINHNGLDNRRANLRLATTSQNCMNRQSILASSSQFKGVTWNRRCKKWQAQIQVSGKSIYLGVFESEISAAVAYDKAAVKYFGEYSHTNFPPQRAS